MRNTPFTVPFHLISMGMEVYIPSSEKNESKKWFPVSATSTDHDGNKKIWLGESSHPMRIDYAFYKVRKVEVK